MACRNGVSPESFRPDATSWLGSSVEEVTRDQAMADYVEYVSARLPALHPAAYLLCGDAHRAGASTRTTAGARVARARPA